MKEDILLQYEMLADLIKSIDNCITNIETTINNVQNKMLEFDDNNWTGKQKEEIDLEYIPYLKTQSKQFPSDLRNINIYLRNAAIQYQLVDQKLQSEVKERLV